jgi:predicted DNA binding protein
MDEESDIVQARFKAKIPAGKWIARYSLKYSDMTFSVLSMLLLDDKTGNVVFQVEGTHVRDIVQDFKSSSPVNNYVILHESPGLLILNVNMNEPLILAAFVETSVPVKYPIVIKAGEATIELVAERLRIDSLLSAIERAGMLPAIHRIGRQAWQPLLTSRQRAILETALESGYFDIPRGIELRNLAHGLGISASTLSENLRRIMRKLAVNCGKTP